LISVNVKAKNSTLPLRPQKGLGPYSGKRKGTGGPTQVGDKGKALAVEKGARWSFRKEETGRAKLRKHKPPRESLKIKRSRKG